MQLRENWKDKVLQHFAQYLERLHILYTKSVEFDKKYDKS